MQSDRSTHYAPSRPAWFRIRYWPTWIALAFLWLIHQLPRRAIHALVPLIAWGLSRGSKRSRRRAEINLAWCFPEQSAEQRQRLLAEHYRYAALVLLDYGFLWFGSERAHQQRLDSTGFEHIANARAQQKPIILLSPHALAIDHGGQGLSMQIPGVSFAKPMRNPVIEWLNHRARTRYGGIMVAREHGLRPALREMRAGRVFYFLPDEDFGASGVVFAEFFGVRKATMTSPTRLARMTGAVVLPVFTYYDHKTDRYTMKIWPALENFPSGSEDEDARAINTAIERSILEAPAQYYWSMRLFNTRPEGLTSPYPTSADSSRAP